MPKNRALLLAISLSGAACGLSATPREAATSSTDTLRTCDGMAQTAFTQVQGLLTTLAPCRGTQCQGVTAHKCWDRCDEIVVGLSDVAAVEEALASACQSFFASGCTVIAPPCLPPDTSGERDAGSSSDASVCPASSESTDGKIGADSRRIIEGAVDPVDVAIVVAGGAKVCNSSSAPEGTCPPIDQAMVLWQQQNSEAQRCVRELISSVGGVSSPEVFALVNVIMARLTWAQILVVAGSPSVTSIEYGPWSPPDRDAGAGASCGAPGTGCHSAHFCEYPVGTCGPAADAGLGTCQQIPSGCLADYTPVCGCDGETYSNACSAHLFGSSVLHEGPCQ